MTMELINIREYAELMREYGLTGVEINQDGCVVRLERNAARNNGVTTPETVKEQNASVNKENVYQKQSSGLTDVVSPMVGVFYTSPAENAEPFVKVGSRVKQGDVLCIIEAMKLMNEITAEEDGTIEEICAEDSQVVDFGHVLFRMKKD